MRRIKTFDNISESASGTPIYTSRFSSYKKYDKPTQIDTYDEPKSLYGMTVTDGKVEWTLQIQHFESGIEIGSEGARIKSLTLHIEKEDEYTGDMEEDTITLEEEDINHELLEYEINKFPLDLDSIEINMNKSEDPKLWKFTMKIGRLEGY